MDFESKESLNLFAGDFPRVTVPVTIASGEGVLTKGTVLGKITASGKYGAYDNADDTGKETAKPRILFEDVDATDSDVETFAYRTGEFNEEALIGLDDSAKADLEDSTIIIKKVY